MICQDVTEVVSSRLGDDDEAEDEFLSTEFEPIIQIQVGGATTSDINNFRPNDIFPLIVIYFFDSVSFAVVAVSDDRFLLPRAA